MIAPDTAGDRFLADPQARLLLGDLARSSSLGGTLEKFRDRSVMILVSRQLHAALALAELDGIARRLVLCTPDLSIPHLMAAFQDASIDIVISDGAEAATYLPAQAARASVSSRLDAPAGEIERNVATEWVLFTSGTTGRPKLAQHTLSSLVGPFADNPGPSGVVWSTFYDVRRYGGLQILLRVLVCGGSMILSDAAEPVTGFLARAAAGGVTHISGTPSHWRRALMSEATGQILPRAVRLSGEVADQSILDGLRHRFPAAEVAHAFASTEAGVALTIRDGQAGFPAALVGDRTEGVELRVENGSLHVRSSCTAFRYLGDDAADLASRNGFVDTGDLVELSGDRYHFTGRRGGIINVGGLKVHPESVEAVINQHDAVLMSRVSSRSSPITGAIVVGEIVLRPTPDAQSDFAAVRREILDLCRRDLASHQVPAILREVVSLDMSPAGKLVRLRA